MKLGDLITLNTKDEEAEFWITRRGSKKSVGKPSKEYNPESYGVHIKPEAKEIILPSYLFYVMQYLHGTGIFERMATGSTNLVNIRKRDILSIPVRM